MRTFQFTDDSLVNLALEEDLGSPWKDITSETLFTPQAVKNQRVQILSKHPQPIIICGLPLVEAIFLKLSPSCQIQTYFREGDRVNSGQSVAEIEGNAIALLRGERTALNFLRHLSAIASLTAQYVSLVKHTGLKILDTRKTTPGLRKWEKYAVGCGGGVNHRKGLYDAIMVKDTHVDLLGGMKETLARLPELNVQSVSVIVEVRTLTELDAVLNYGKNKVNRVLLDNMSLEELVQAVSLCKNIFETEASGNITQKTVVEIAETGVEYASIGELTYGAGQVDLSMRSL